MQKTSTSHFIPVLTSMAGACLTCENWQEAGVTMASFHLASLLMKPGFELLCELPDISSYNGWPGDVVLNASMLKIDKEGGYLLRSEYDGSRRRYTQEDILSLISHLNPQCVLLPAGMRRHDSVAWQTLPDSILPFFMADDLPNDAGTRSYGVYFSYEASTSTAQVLDQLHQYKELPCYVFGELSAPLVLELVRLSVAYVESDIPAFDASQGVVYAHDGVVSIKDNGRLDFRVIDDSCSCSTCQQKLTRAYLHHLLEHTPLLCQRFLIQHAISFTVSHLRKP